MTHILLDENMPKTVKEWLKRKGFTATSVQETNLKGAKDTDIVNYAQKNKLAILTMDTDFAQIYYNTRPKDTFTVIVVKAKPRNTRQHHRNPERSPKTDEPKRNPKQTRNNHQKQDTHN